MNRLLIILFSSLIFSSCENKQGVESYWRLDFNEQVENPFFPYELGFLKDTLKIVGGNNFKQTSSFNRTNDSILLTFENGIEWKYSFSVKSDSTIIFANKKFIRITEDNFSKTQPYELIGYQAEKLFQREPSSTIVHLVKDGNSTKVILNDKKSELNDLPMFLNRGHSKLPLICLYLGKGIDFNDLIKVYCWIKVSGLSKVELVTFNKSFEEFYSVKDYVNIGDTLFSNFLKNKQVPPLPPSKKTETREIVELYINDRDELKSKFLMDTVDYLINVSDKLNIIDYLKLTEEVNSKNNAKKKITRLTTRG